ncbi:hypothetical protein L484_016462 [Morus notabilis]|uniref:Uncharacterized protein n=1 Tax=Morus notabilis TaxID=981085 RepID=W9R5N3_9ROSA|nr:hypothetical protein L484_016462 [Morus notabilis]
MKCKSEIISSSFVPAMIVVLLVVHFSTPVFASCKGAKPPPPHPSPPERPGCDVVATNGHLLRRMTLAAGDGYSDEDGCIGSLCSGTKPCCPWCLCIPVPGRSGGICLGLCCLFDNWGK